MLCPKHPLLAIYCCPLSGKSCQSRWLRLWRRVPRKTAFPWWKPETVPDALCTFFTSGSLNQNLICNAFWFFFCSQRKPDFRLGSKTGSIHVLKMLTTITILSQIKGHLVFSLSSIRSRTRKFSLRPANFLLHTILFANSAHSILEQIQIGLDLRLLRRIFFSRWNTQIQLKITFSLVPKLEMQCRTAYKNLARLTTTTIFPPARAPGKLSERTQRCVSSSSFVVAGNGWW